MNDKGQLEVYHYPYKTRMGQNGDGGYVICELPGKYDCFITCGIADEASFDRDFLAKYSYLRKHDSYGFDGTIHSYPEHFTNQVTFTRKNINGHNDDNNTNLHDLIDRYHTIFLSMDIEGGEYLIYKQLIEYGKSKEVRKIFVWRAKNNLRFSFVYNL